MKKEQVIYINLDDSGKLSKNELYCVYGGIVFFDKREKDKFITQYRSIVNDLKCSYCQQQKGICNNHCVELKSYNLKASHKRRLLNYIKKYYTIGCVIHNQTIFNHILEDKASKGRYIDYAIRRMIKEVINVLIQDKVINAYKPVKIILNIDEQPTKSNGYYNLKDGLTEELIHGIYNFNYNKVYKPILFNTLDIHLRYQHSDKSYVIQAADLVAGSIRHKVIEALKEEDIRNCLGVDYILFLP